MSVRRSVWVGCALLMVGACGTTGGSVGDGGAPSTTLDGAPSGNANGAAVDATPHSPATGCRPGFKACGNVCADVTSDWCHCGECDHACGSEDGGAFTRACVASRCVAEGGCAFGISCDGICARPSSQIDHCGSCGNRCSDRQICYESACLDTQGDGSSCSSPIVLPSDDSEFETRFSAAFTSAHIFPCGPLQGVPTRWFRWTARKTRSTDVQIKHALANDNYVVEVFDGAACDAPSSRVCNDDAKPGTDLRPRASFDAVAGHTYFIAFGVVAAPSGIVPALRFDD